MNEAETGWTAVEREMERWQQAGQQPRLFLRDDDAVAATPALDRLTRVIRRHEVPLLLASIPAHAEESLGAAVRGEELITGAVHGWAHRDHSPIGEKPSELGPHRPPETVLGELRRGRERLGELFGGQLSELLVPPWNRIDETVLALAGEAGFGGVSAHGWLDATPPVAMVNVHIDIIHWSGGRVGRSAEWIAAELARNLAEARKRGYRAIGILTHHLDHDEAAWAGLEAILSRLGPQNATWHAEWIGADDLIGEPAEPNPGGSDTA